MVEDSNLPKTPRPIMSKKISYLGGMTYCTEVLIYIATQMI